MEIVTFFVNCTEVICLIAMSILIMVMAVVGSISIIRAVIRENKEHS